MADADGKMRMGKCGWENGDGKMGIEKCGWKKVFKKIRQKNIYKNNDKKIYKN